MCLGGGRIFLEGGGQLVVNCIFEGVYSSQDRQFFQQDSKMIGGVREIDKFWFCDFFYICLVGIEIS